MLLTADTIITRFLIPVEMLVVLLAVLANRSPVPALIVLGVTTAALLLTTFLVVRQTGSYPCELRRAQFNRRVRQHLGPSGP